MAEIDSEYKQWKSSLITILITVAFVCALLLNVIFIFVFIRSKKLRRAPNLFLLNIAIVDLFAAMFWALPAIVASSDWKWKLGGHYCKFHGFIGMFCFSMNMYNLCAISFEKFLKIMFPSKHADAFHNYTITLVVTSSLWVLSIVMSFMPLIGWGLFKFYNYQMQCVTDFVESVTHLNFFFVNVFCLPVIALFTLYIITLVRIKLLQKRGTQNNGKIILEEKKGVPTESFADKMRRQQDKFKYRHKKDSSKPAISDDTGKLNASDESDMEAYLSDDNEIFHDYEEYAIKKRERDQARRRKKVYTFRQQYLFMSITMLVVSVIYIGLWVPFFVVTYTWVYDPDSVKETTYTTFAVVTFFGMSYKPVVYFFNKHIRACAKQAFTRKKKNPAKKLAPDHIAKYQADGESPPGTAATSAHAQPMSRDAHARPVSRGFETTDMRVDEMDDIEL